MKHSYLSSAFLTTVFFAVISCSKNEKMHSVEFKRFSLAEVCTGSVLKSSTEKEKTIVITSEQMLATEVGCLVSPPQVDFNTHFVLAGRVAFNNCAELETEAISDAGNILKYSVHIRQSECQKIDTVYFMVALPVRYKNHQVDFEIKY